MNSEQEKHKFMFAKKPLDWAQIVICQGERLINTSIELNRLSSKSFDDKLSLPELNKAYEIYSNNKFRSLMERHFFVISLGKSLYYFKITSEFSHIADALCNKFGKTTIDDLRNMTEHEDDFVCGNGRTRPQNFTYDDPIRNGTCDATSTLVDFSKREYLIGGRLNVFDVIDFYKEKFGEIKAISDKIIQEIEEK